MLAAGGARGQQSPFFSPKPPTPSGQPAQPTPPGQQSPFFSPNPPTPPAQPSPPSPVVARVQGRPITQADFDRIAQPYYERLRGQLKQGFTPEMQRLAARSVINELVRHHLMLIEAERRGITVSEAETDQYLSRDPFFLTNGAFDRQKLIQFKIDPNSNYATILPRIREQVMVSKVDSTVRARLAPSRASVRDEWTRRNQQVRFAFLALGLRDVSLEPEATEAEQAAYYAAHPEAFERRGRTRLRYLRVPLPPEGDARRPAARDSAMQRAQGLADSLRAGVSIDSVAAGVGRALDTGLFDLPATAIPGLGAAPALVGAIAGADSDTTIRVVGPAETPEGVMVALVTERHRSGIPPRSEIAADVKRRADVEKRRTAAEAKAREFYESHRSNYRAPQITVTRVLASEAKARGALQRLADLWGAGRDLPRAARAAGATVESRSFVPGAHDDSIFPVPVIDSLFLGHEARLPGPIQGPRPFGRFQALWRVEAVDSAFVLPFEAARPRVDAAVAAEQRAQDEAEARAYFEAHRTQYKARTRTVVDYIAVRPAHPDSVSVPVEEIQKDYGTQAADFRQQEQVRARHILIAPDVSLGADADARARARIDSLARALRAGADFEDLARRFSQDPGSAARAGDLGFFERGRMVKEFSDTAFALAPGQVSQPVRTNYGYHLIRVEERRPAELRPLDEVRDQVRRRLARSIADSTAARRARAMRREIGRGRDPDTIAAPVGGVVRLPRFAPEDPLPGLGSSPELAQELPRLRLDSWAPAVYRFGGAHVLIRPVRRETPTQAEFEEVRGEALRDMKNAKREELLAQKVEGIRARLGAGASLDSLAAAHGGLKDSGILGATPGFVPNLGFEPRLVARAMALPLGAASDTLKIAQGVAWIRTEEKKTLPGGSFEKDRAAIAQELAATQYNEWIEAKKKATKIEILRADLREAPAPVIQPIPTAQGR